MGNITEYLSRIKTAIFGKDVRNAIHDSIKQVYEDASKNGNVNMEVIEARGIFSTLNKRIENIITSKADQIIINNLQAQINALASGGPLKANSIEEMTDKNRIYVNVADGYWYYWNGSNWIQGDVFQSAQSGAVINDLDKRIKNLEGKRVIRTIFDKDTVKEVYDDETYKVSLFDLNNIYEKWYSSEGVLIIFKTITITANGVTEVVN